MAAMGDGMLVELVSVADAVRCAVDSGDKYPPLLQFLSPVVGWVRPSH